MGVKSVSRTHSATRAFSSEIPDTGQYTMPNGMLAVMASKDPPSMSSVALACEPLLPSRISIFTLCLVSVRLHCSVNHEHAPERPDASPSSGTRGRADRQHARPPAPPAPLVAPGPVTSSLRLSRRPPEAPDGPDQGVSVISTWRVHSWVSTTAPCSRMSPTAVTSAGPSSNSSLWPCADTLTG